MSGPRIAALVLLAFSPGWTAAGPAALQAKAESLDPPTELAAPVAKLLGKDAVVVADGDGDAVLTIWFRAEVPAKATAEQVKNGLTYREIPEGTLVGAVRFARPFVDYRKQEIAAGVYTLRFAVQPDVGDHLGTAPHPEFLLLSPAAKDDSADPLDGKTLVKLSSASTGGDHPGVMLLFPYTGADAGPNVVEKADGVRAVVTRRPVVAEELKATLGFAITVAGHSKTR